MEISLAGLGLSLAVLAPNLLLVVAPPAGVPATMPSVPRTLTVLERAGQAGCLVAPALTGGSGGLSGVLLLVVVLVAGYHGLWVRYLTTGRRFATLYAPLGPVPVPMAILPVLAFGVGAIWLASWPLAVASVVLAAGHVPTSWLIRRRLPAS